MAAPNEKLAESLTILKELQAGRRRVFQSSEIGRVHRERLVQSGFLREVMKGWLISAGPSATDGDTTPWFASFWEFCDRYCHDRFGDEWHLSPEQSLLLHAEATAIPMQVVVYSPRGGNNTLDLLFGTSLYDLKQKQMAPGEDIVVKNGLRLYTAEAALIKVSENFFERNPIEGQVVLASLQDASSLLRRLLDGGHSAVAGRLAGAFRNIGRDRAADDILKTMKSAHYSVREVDPFATHQRLPLIAAGTSPIVGRIHVIWSTARQSVIDAFPPSPGLPNDRIGYLDRVEENYKNDAYHSLSIEGYNVSPELIDRVRQGTWNPAANKADQDSRDAMAARGYWQAFQSVKDSIAKILEGAPAGALVNDTHRDWYREMFQPSVVAGLLPAGTLAGYRNHAVFLRGSRHVPPRADVLPDAMTALFDHLEAEPEASVRAVLGHWLIGYIHPFPDGNGRMARFLMNAMLASGGYPWTVVRLDDRARYLAALESASIDMDIRPFAEFIAERVQTTIQQAM